MKLGYRLKKYFLAFIVLVAFGILYAIASPKGTPWLGADSHLLNLSLGAFGGFFVLLVQFIVDDSRDKELEVLQAQKIVRVLETRDDDQYYVNLIKSAKREIVVCGVTASRFVLDFANEQSPRADKKALITAINRGVLVRILIADAEHLSADESTKAATVRPKFVKLQHDHGSKFEVREYAYRPAFSLTIIDDDCLFGPVFPGTKSQHSPTIHALRSGHIADFYVRQFEKQWEDAVVLSE